MAYYLPYLQGMTALSHLEQTPDHANTAAQVASNLLNKTTQARLRGQLLYQRAAAYAAVGENDAAETDLRNALRGDPQPLAPRLLLADLLFRDGRRDQAAEHYDKAAADFPDDPLVFNNRGRFRMRIKEPELAVVDFSTSLRLNPQFATAYRNRALALLATGDPAAAEQDLTMAIQLSPRDPVLRRLRASCRLLELRPQDAVEDLQRSVDLRPDPRSLADLAMAHTMNRDPEAALQTFRQLRQSHPELRYLRPWHCAALLAAHRPDEASQTFAPELARVETAPDTCFWSDWLVGTLIGPISEATLIQQAARRPGTGRKTEAYYFLGEKAELSDDPETAREYYRKAVRLGRQDLAAYRAARIAIAVPSPSTIAPASNSQASP